MKNIRAVYYTDHGLADEYKVVFYQSAFEMVLMQFLYCVQSGEVFCLLYCQKRLYKNLMICVMNIVEGWKSPAS